MPIMVRTIQDVLLGKWWERQLRERLGCTLATIACFLRVHDGRRRSLEDSRSITKSRAAPVCEVMVV